MEYQSSLANLSLSSSRTERFVWTDIAGFEKLTELSICYNPQLDNIKFLSKMTELKSLTIEMGCFTVLSLIYLIFYK